MPRNAWRQGLSNAFPIPEDRLPKPDPSPSNAECSSVARFDFLNLPRELRDRVYHFVLFSEPSYEKAPAPSILTVNRQCHEEAARVLYSHTPIRVFLKQEFQSPPSVWEVPRRYRKWVTTLEIILGTSWTSPPKSWRVTKSLARLLSKFEAVRRLEIFVEMDPSIPLFDNHRVSETFYTDFCGLLLRNTLLATPQVKIVQIDGNTFVKKNGPLVARLRETTEKQGMTVTWGFRNFGAVKSRELKKNEGST